MCVIVNSLKRGKMSDNCLENCIQFYHLWRLWFACLKIPSRACELQCIMRERMRVGWYNYTENDILFT